MVPKASLSSKHLHTSVVFTVIHDVQEDWAAKLPQSSFDEGDLAYSRLWSVHKEAMCRRECKQC